jgi:hypothetical protein
LHALTRRKEKTNEDRWTCAWSAKPVSFQCNNGGGSFFSTVFIRDAGGSRGNCKRTDLQGAGFYRFNIGDFKATVISDGHGMIPFWPTLAANQPEAAVLPALEASYLKPVNQFTCNMLVVDTGREKILVDTGFGEVLGSKFGHFSDLKVNLLRAVIPPEASMLF